MSGNKAIIQSNCPVNRHLSVPLNVSFRRSCINVSADTFMIMMFSLHIVNNHVVCGVQGQAYGTPGRCLAEEHMCKKHFLKICKQ